jgi:hypothetical protein
MAFIFAIETKKISSSSFTHPPFAKVFGSAEPEQKP